MAKRPGTTKKQVAAKADGTSLVVDAVTQFALDVVDGRKFIVSHKVLQACQRHLRDLEEGPSRGLVWNPDEAHLAIEFFETVLRLPEESDGDDEAHGDTDDAPVDGTPFILSPWQKFVVGSLMGWWRQKGNSLRLRFRTAYIETGKGSGKTPMCAGLLIYISIRFGQRAAQIYVAAVTREQAQIGFADCEKMVNASPFLRDVFRKTVNNLAIQQTGTFIRAISSEKRALDGKRVSAAMIDEIHEQRTAVVVNKIRKGIKGRPNAIILEPTNAGFDRTSVCWHHHEYSRKVLDGLIPAADADEWFAFVCALDPCEACRAKGREFPDEDCADCDDWQTEGPHWLKANPNLGVSIPWHYIRGLVNEAKGMPDGINDLLRFNFGIWTQSVDRAFDLARWQECGGIDIPKDEELADYPCFGGLDLGQTDDMAAWARAWDLGDLVVVKLRFWLPKAAKEKFPERPYAEWERYEIDGHKMLELTEGSTTDEATIEATVLEDARKSGVLEIGFDKRFANRMAQNLMGHDLVMVDTPQGFWLNESIRRISKLVADRKFAHGGNALLAYQAGVAVLRKGPNNVVRFDKEASKDKIDGLSAVAMAISRMLVEPPDGPADDPELITA